MAPASDEAKAAEAFALNAVVDVTLPAAAVFLRPKLKVRLRCVGPSAYAPVFDPFHAGGADAAAAPDAPAAPPAAEEPPAAAAPPPPLAKPPPPPPPPREDDAAADYAAAAAAARGGRCTRGATSGGEKLLSPAMAYYRAMHPEEETTPTKPREASPPREPRRPPSPAPPSPAAPPALRAEVGVAAAGPADALAVARGGARFVEICADSAGALVACLGAVRGLGVMTHVHLRPRGGWRLSAWGAAALRVDVALARQHGASTVVVGPLDDCGFLDLPLVAELAEAARPARVAICRESFDASPDPAHGLRALANAGVDAVYSSGGADRARDGADALRTLVAAGNEARVAVMVCRVAADDVPPLVDATGAFFFVLDDADGGVAG